MPLGTPQLPPPTGSQAVAEVVPLRAQQGPSDRQIVEAIKTGQAQGSAWLFDRFARDVHRTVGRLLGPDADHEDLVHEVFLKAWALIQKGKLREPDKLGGWLRALAAHGVYKEIRRRYVRRRFLRHEAASLVEVHLVHGEERDLVRVLYRIAELMAPQERFAFSLRHFEQRQLQDVAIALDCSLATAKRRLAKAEEQFRRLSRPFEKTYPALRELFHEREGSQP